MAAANRSVLAIAQVETAKGVQEARAIAGVDAVAAFYAGAGRR